jgi:hypothetical protein
MTYRNAWLSHVASSLPKREKNNTLLRFFLLNFEALPINLYTRIQ